MDEDSVIMEDTSGASGTSADNEEKVSKLVKGTKKIKIADHDVNDWDQLVNSFKDHYITEHRSKFSKSATNRGSNKTPLCVLSDVFCDEGAILTGFTDGTCKVVKLGDLPEHDIITLDPRHDWKHIGLSEIRCSRVSPFLFFTSSINGSIRQWDTRDGSRKFSQEFSTESDGSKSRKKPILKFDVSCSDQLLCGGTELVEEDSYLLFWDVRSTKLLGAYWESHSDDIVAVKFHQSQMHSLASGSTDGLLNVFNLLEPAEDDALLFSFNTNSSVDTISWNTSNSNVTCVTHTNEVQVWDAISGDRVTEISRDSLAKAMRRSNPEAVHISGCHNLQDSSRLGLVTCSLSAGNARLLEINEEMEPVPRGLFMDQTAVIQSSQFLNKRGKWITFDEHGIIKLWNAKQSTLSESETNPKRHKKTSEERRGKKRFTPYNRD